MPSRHTNQEFESDLAKLRESILMMGAKVEKVIKASVDALMTRDSTLAKKAIDADREINRLELKIDGACLQILAKFQPVASDLRFITISMKLVTDLERIADLGVNISERVLELNEDPPLKPYVDLPHMADVAIGMVHDALDAFVAGDAGQAKDVIDRDETVDAYYAQIFRELLTYMMEDPKNIQRATRLQSIAKYLERIADHATNLSEMIIFYVKGTDVRHLGSINRAP
ncbi:MAG: phosphate signaling complex protein PhoU [Deltaproteobacteria bacterium]|nr:phosphate signaling complex protein PhoU [Deltaproteobacteria bacterium]